MNAKLSQYSEPFLYYKVQSLFVKSIHIRFFALGFAHYS